MGVAQGPAIRGRTPKVAFAVPRRGIPPLSAAACRCESRHAPPLPQEGSPKLRWEDPPPDIL
jgi:hypothetical protein